MDKTYDYIIIGSGFGGSVSALRLAEKGYSVLVIEKGRRFNAKDYAKTNWNLWDYLWFPPLGFHGIQALSFLKDVFILHGAGVGGGSLVYANTLLKPPSRFFTDNRWSHLRDWKAELMPFYDVALGMLGATPAPSGAEGDQVLREIAEDMGKGDTFHRPTVAVYRGEPGQTVTDPYFGGEGPDRTGCIECGGCMVGCRYNAKNTLDKNYLYFAEKLGAEFLPEREVVDVRPADGGYEVETRRSTSLLYREPKTFRSEKVVFAGGVMGTVKLLHECKDRGSLPNLSHQLGNFVRTNSEALLAVTADNDEKDYSRGIAISAGFHPDEDTHVETVRYSKGSDFMSTLTTFLTPGGGGSPRWAHFLATLVKKPWTFVRLFWPFKWARRTVILLVMQPIDNYLKVTYKRRWYTLFTKHMDSDVGDSPGVPSYIPVANEVAERAAEKMGGTPQSGLFEVTLGVANTAHILGGCAIAESADEGVIDPNHEVFGHPGLYVVDGSMIPANLGVNPSLTITAMAERAMSLVPAKPGHEGRHLTATGKEEREEADGALQDA